MRGAARRRTRPTRHRGIEAVGVVGGDDRARVRQPGAQRVDVTRRQIGDLGPLGAGFRQPLPDLGDRHAGAAVDAFVDQPLPRQRLRASRRGTSPARRAGGRPVRPGRSLPTRTRSSCCSISRRDVVVRGDRHRGVPRPALVQLERKTSVDIARRSTGRSRARAPPCPSPRADRTPRPSGRGRTSPLYPRLFETKRTAGWCWRTCPAPSPRRRSTPTSDPPE